MLAAHLESGIKILALDMNHHRFAVAANPCYRHTRRPGFEKRIRLLVETA